MLLSPARPAALVLRPAATADATVLDEFDAEAFGSLTSLLKGMTQSGKGGAMLTGLMQSCAAADQQHHEIRQPSPIRDREIVSRLVDEPLWRYDWARCEARARPAAQALAQARRRRPATASPRSPGTRTAISSCSTRAPGMGAVLHTANPRLVDEQIVYTINHAGSAVLLFERSFVELVAAPAPAARAMSATS